MGPEVIPGCLWWLVVESLVSGFGLSKVINVAGICVTELTGGVLGGVSSGLFDLIRDIEGVSWGFWNGQSEVEGKQTWDGTETNDDSPHLVTCFDTSWATVAGADNVKLVLVAGDTDNGDNTSHQLTPTLVGKDSTHDCTSPFCGGELGGDDGGQWVVTSDTNTHDDSVECQDGGEVDSGRVAGGTLQDSGGDHDDQLDTVDGLTSENVGKPTETHLADDCSD